ncbi:hypothetical protein GF325_18185 [Candidatus Bathyarchaeota archaeon]|nr:hypothetical protein [Candidatus Bathyarchaeota archaeon]
MDPRKPNLFRFRVNDSSNVTSTSTVFSVEVEQGFKSNASLLLSNGNQVAFMNLDGDISWSITMTNTLDKEMLSNGNILVTRGWIGGGEILEIAPDGEIVKNYTKAGELDFNWPHDADMLPNGNLLVADTLNDRVVEINPDGSVNWSWRVQDVMNPLDHGASTAYVNDADRLEDGRTIACLRDLNMVVIVGENGDIEWSFGDPGDDSLLNRPHNPDMLENGNILICDSENARIVEINKNMEITWTFKPNISGDPLLSWPRDADLVDDELLIVSDTRSRGKGENAIYFFNRTTGEGIWEFHTMGANYDTDYLQNRVPDVKILSPLNTSYRFSRAIDVIFQESRSWRNLYYNIRDETTGEWIHENPVQYQEPRREYLMNDHHYMIEAWGNSTTGGSGWPQDDSLLLTQDIHSSTKFTIKLNCTMPDDEPYEGTTMLSITQPAKIIEVNHENEILWEYDYNPPDGFDLIEVYMYDFERLPNDHVVYGILLRLSNGSIYHLIEEIDRGGTVTWRKEFNGTLVGDNHDIDYLPDIDEFLMASANDDAVLQLNRSGDVTWSWFAEDYFTRTTDDDWTHINDVQRLENGNTIISLRNLDIILEVNESGDIVWQIGDVTNGSMLNHQHHPTRLPNGNTIVCDSDNHRVIELDPSGNITWTSDDYPSLNLIWPRSMNPLPNGNMIILTPNQKRVIEISRNGSIVWEHNGSYVFSAERIDRYAPVPDFIEPRDKYYNETIPITMQCLAPDFHELVYNMKNLDNGEYYFKSNKTWDGEYSVNPPWGRYQILTWTFDTGTINLYQGNQGKSNEGLFTSGTITIAPVVKSVSYEENFHAINIEWDGVAWVEEYEVYMGYGSYPDGNTTTSMTKKHVTTDTQARFRVNGNGDVYFAVMATNATHSSPLSKFVLVKISPKYPTLMISCFLLISLPGILLILDSRRKKKEGKVK